MTVLDLDDESTWPGDLLSFLGERFDVLRAYEQHERGVIDRRNGGDRTMSYAPPRNPYEAARDAALLETNALLKGLKLVGYHCTRLHHDEIESICRDGLRPLSAELARDRVRRRVGAGDFSVEVAERVLAKGRTEERDGERRVGMLWFLFTAGSLREEGGLELFFRLWGGEALYFPHHEDPQIGPILRRLGTACIVRAAVPVEAIQTGCSVGERIVRCSLHRRGVRMGECPGWEGWIAESVPGEGIQRVIRRSDADFERLTGCATWDDPVT
jgi:hypothetical protein